MYSERSFLRWHIFPYWRSFVMVLLPLLLLPLPVISATKEARCGYVIMVMAGYWVAEVLPIPVTGIIPVFAFPLLGILSTGELCMVYMKETNMLFIGGLTVAISVEACNLHQRIALFVILHVGQSPRRLMAGFMMTTMFLSMWISNTATTAMMVPIVDAILMELYTTQEERNVAHSASGDVLVSAAEQQQLQHLSSEGDSDTHPASSCKDVSVSEETENNNAMPTNGNNKIPDDYIQKQRHYMRRALLLGVAYAANCGGTGVVTGTGPNLVLMGILSDSFSEPTGLNFATWMAFNVPGMIICVIICWLWLQFLFMGLCRKNSPVQHITPEREIAVKKLIRKKYTDLGPISHHEATVLTLFIILVFLWLFRAPEFIPGWSAWFTDAFGEDLELGDATPAILIAFLLFVLPSSLDFWCFRDPKDTKAPKRSPACMNWQILHEKIPWGIILLIGGGFAMAEASEKSGLSKWLGIQFASFDVMPKEAIVFVVSLMTAMLTEVTSNTATASILLPVLKEMALNIQVNPLYLMLPATVACSYAFMLPVATPPNAIVFSASNMRSIDMVKAGFIMNIICVLVITLTINTLGVALFDLNEMPSWTNSTTSSL
ncbi:hypothetical protein SK128_008058 [Halocaridina rubra]|uniref:Solute carrier family 13 member 5 n=1 Tax=Halocaridina rubra TaxID=373956 RepID=A0AAN9AAQ9_HALRR